MNINKDSSRSLVDFTSVLSALPKIPGKALLFAFAFLFSISSWAWELPVCMGNAKDGWAAGDNNWRWDYGNPYPVEGGAEWTVATQNMVNPSGTDEYKPMEPSVLFGFLKGWAAGKNSATDPEKFLYFGEEKEERKLSASASLEGHFPQVGPTSVIIFKVPKDGKYQVEIEGKVTVQSKTAGYAKVSVAILSEARKQETPLKSFELNSAGGFGGYGDILSFSDTVEIKAGNEIVIRLQAVSPGPSSAGSSTIAFKKCGISLAEKK